MHVKSCGFINTVWEGQSESGEKREKLAERKGTDMHVSAAWLNANV